MSVAFGRFEHELGGRGLRASTSRVVAKIKTFAMSITRRKAIEDLGRLDDRMLADVGLSRADLRAAAQWSLWGDPTDRLAAAAEERRLARGR